MLLLGETGTGKELVAHAIHEASSREEGPFVAVDCAGMTETLFESELFGYEKGAFTGAMHTASWAWSRPPPAARCFSTRSASCRWSQQVKLLRLLETGTYRRVGGLDWLPADFRLIAATHRDLRAMVAGRNLPARPVFPHQHLSDSLTGAARAGRRDSPARRIAARTG